MPFQYKPSTSRSARLARRLGSLGLPVLVIAAVGHHFDWLGTDHALAALLVGFGLAALALLAGIIGLIVIWNEGDHGATDAALGIVYALIALAPLAPLGYELWRYPKLTDISTDIIDPPLYRSAALLRAGHDNSARPPSPEALKLQRAAYPDIVTRRFSVGSDLVYVAAKKVVERHGWQILEAQPPKDDNDRARIETVARTMIMGFAEDIVIRIVGEPSGARIDIRSSSRFGRHDLGDNARRIRAFLAELDTAMAESYGQSSGD